MSEPCLEPCPSHICLEMTKAGMCRHEVATLRSQLLTAQRELTEARADIERIRDELMAANLDVSISDPAGSLAHHVFVLRMALETRGENMDLVAADRDAARGEVERLRADLAREMVTVERVYGDKIADEIATWIHRRWSPFVSVSGMDRDDLNSVLADIRAGKWRKEPK